MKLSQVLAREAQEKSRVAEAYKWFTSGIGSFVMDGFARTYEPADEDGEQLAPEEKVVQWTWQKVISEMRRYTSSYVNAVAAKDYGNREAFADVVVDGATLLADAPVPFLLFLEKHLLDYRGFINALPARDRGKRWEEGEGDLWQTQPTFKNRSIKQKVPIVKYEATKEHPAQTEMVEQSVYVGRYSQIDYSGQPSAEEKEAIVARIDSVITAVRSAREEANAAKVSAPKGVAEAVFGYIFQ